MEYGKLTVYDILLVWIFLAFFSVDSLKQISLKGVIFLQQEN